jgi:hypothetical protein
VSLHNVLFAFEVSRSLSSLIYPGVFLASGFNIISPMSKSQQYALLDGEEISTIYDSPQDQSFGRWYKRKNLHLHLPLASFLGLSLTLNAFLLTWCLYLSIDNGCKIERSQYGTSKAGFMASTYR